MLSGRSEAQPWGRALPVAPAFTIEIEKELDGRWLAEVPVVPSVLAYGSRRAEAAARAEALALRALAERIEHGEPVPEISGLFVEAARGSRRPERDSAFVGPMTDWPSARASRVLAALLRMG